MSDPTDRPADTAGPPSELVAPAVGLLVVTVAVSSLLDDSGLVEHPWWVALVVGAIIAAMALAGRTIAKLVSEWA